MPAIYICDKCETTISSNETESKLWYKKFIEGEIIKVLCVHCLLEKLDSERKRKGRIRSRCSRITGR